MSAEAEAYRWLSRKLWFCFALVLIATGLYAWAALPAEVWSGVVTTIVLTYVGGNVGSTAVDALKAYLTTRTGPQP